MAGPITLVQHLPFDEVDRRFRTASDVVERTHWQAIRMVMLGASGPQILLALGWSRAWLFQIVGRYNEGGPEALGDKRKFNRRERFLDDAQFEELGRKVSEAHAAGEPWVPWDVARYIGALLGREPSYELGRQYLHRLGYSPQKPRPQHADADMEAQEAFKRGVCKQP